MEHQGLLFHPAMRGCPLNVPWLLLCCFRCYSHLVLVGTAVLTGIGFSFAFLIVRPACQVSMILCCAFGDKCPHLVLKLFFFFKKGCFPEQLLDMFLILKAVCDPHPPKGTVTFDRGLCSHCDQASSAENCTLGTLDRGLHISALPYERVLSSIYFISGFWKQVRQFFLFVTYIHLDAE